MRVNSSSHTKDQNQIQNPVKSQEVKTKVVMDRKFIMEFRMFQQFARRCCISGRVGSSSSVVGKQYIGLSTTIIHQRSRAMSVLGFSNTTVDSYRNIHLMNHQKTSFIRYFGSKDLNGDSSSSKDGEEDEGDQIVKIYGDRPDYETSSDTSKFTHEIKVEMPDVGDSTGGTIETWYKKPGDIIQRDEVICDIRTEQFTFGMLTDDDFDSVMGEILVEEESGVVEPGTVICTTFSEDKHHRDNDDEDGNA